MSTSPPAGLSYEEFCAALSEGVPVDLVVAPPTSRLLGDLRLDELSLCLLHHAVEELNPHFVLPDQSDDEFVTLGDVYHYYRWMDAEQVEP